MVGAPFPSRDACSLRRSRRWTGEPVFPRQSEAIVVTADCSLGAKTSQPCRLVARSRSLRLGGEVSGGRWDPRDPWIAVHCAPGSATPVSPGPRNGKFFGALHRWVGLNGWAPRPRPLPVRKKSPPGHGPRCVDLPSAKTKSEGPGAPGTEHPGRSGRHGAVPRVVSLSRKLDSPTPSGEGGKEVVRAGGIEPPSQAWEAHIITTIRRPRSCREDWRGREGGSMPMALRPAPRGVDRRPRGPVRAPPRPGGGGPSRSG